MARLSFRLGCFTAFGCLLFGLTAAVFGLFVVTTRRGVILAAHRQVAVAQRHIPIVLMMSGIGIAATIVTAAAVHRATIPSVIAVLTTQIRVRRRCRIVVVMAVVLVERSTTQRRSAAGHRR